MSASISSYTTDFATSADGTTIGYRQLGHGPGMIILHGGMRSSQDYMRLATTLSDTFTVYVVDRRGRGLSGPHGPQYSIAKECEDLDAVLMKTGAHFVIGHSAGGLIALQAALNQPAIHKFAVYEPPLSIHGSFPLAWLPKYEQELAQGKLASAMITNGRSIPIMKLLTIRPRWLILPIVTLLLQIDKRMLKPGEVSIESLIPTHRFDMQLVKAMDGSLENFKAIRVEVFLLGSQKTPVFLRTAVEALSKTIPSARRIHYPDLNHDGLIDGDPERIGADLRTFFEK